MRGQWLRVTAFLAVIALGMPTNAEHPSPCPWQTCDIRSQDQIWMISTRHLGTCSNPPTPCRPQLCYHCFDPCHGWVPSNQEAFFAGDDPQQITTVYVHGNRISDAWAQDRGFKTYCSFTCECDAPPIRHVIWSWPSEPIPCRSAIIRDARVKARRTPIQSYYLAWWLSNLQPELQVSLAGFSYGGRTILGAAHILGGGTLCGRGLASTRYGCTVRPRIAIMATASQADWLLPGHCYGCAMSQIERGLIIYNCCDPVLRRYEKLIPESTGPALGLVGIPCGLGDDSCKLQQFNASQIIGKNHKFKLYYQSPEVMGLIRNYVLWRPVD